MDYFPLLCVHHPDEPAQTGIPAERFSDPRGAVDGYVHYCGPCAADFHQRWAAALTQARQSGV